MGRGIDYGNGLTNVDLANGIRYGVIGMNCEHLSEWAWEGMESDYGDPACPKCGGTVVSSDEAPEGDTADTDHKGDKDWYCPACELSHWSDAVYGDEAIGHDLDSDGYRGRVDSHNDLMLFKSPFFTLCQFCSPCAPGAGHLENAVRDGVKTYALGHDWFRDGVAPYPVYSVETGELVAPDDGKWAKGWDEVEADDSPELGGEG